MCGDGQVGITAELRGRSGAVPDLEARLLGTRPFLPGAHGLAVVPFPPGCHALVQDRQEWDINRIYAAYVPVLPIMSLLAGLISSHLSLWSRFARGTGPQTVAEEPGSDGLVENGRAPKSGATLSAAA